MKTKSFAIFCVALISLGVLGAPLALAEASKTPTGGMTINQSIVQVGARPTLTWDISYPPIIEQFIKKEPTKITPIIDLLCDVRILGLGVTSQNSKGKIIYYQTKGQWKYNGSTTWETLYDGKQTDRIVAKQGIVKSSILCKKGMEMTFAGQYFSGDWKPQYTSTDTTTYKNVRILISGETCPGNIPDYDAPSLETFLKPFLDSSKRVKIGPMDVIVIAELTHTDTTSVGYDIQDLVMLFTFSKP
jgi:hypothetical protein